MEDIGASSENVIYMCEEVEEEERDGQTESKSANKLERVGINKI